jgi:hypothetical protein
MVPRWRSFTRRCRLLYLGFRGQNNDIIGRNIPTGIANASCVSRLFQVYVAHTNIQVDCVNILHPGNHTQQAPAMGNGRLASAFVFLGTYLAAAFVRDNTGGAGGWRWAYYFNGIIYGVTALSIAVTYFHVVLCLAVITFSKRLFLGLTTLESSHVRIFRFRDHWFDFIRI